VLLIAAAIRNASRLNAGRWATSLALGSLLLFGLNAQAQQQVPTDYVFVVDVSGSMVGKGGSANIFPQVKEAIKAFLSEIGPGSDVYIAPFEARVRAIKRFSIQDASDANDARSYVDGLIADGSSTAIYNSVNEVLSTVNSSRAPLGNDRTAVFFVYTDGNDNVSRDWTLGSFLENFNLKRGKRDWLFYTELGLPRNPAKASAFSKFERMRYNQENKGDVHPIVQVETLLPILNFGNLKQNPSAERVERFTAMGAGSVKKPILITAKPDFPQLSSQGVRAQLSPQSFPPSDSVRLHLSLTNAEALSDGEYDGSVRLVPNDPLVLVVPSEIDVSFSYGAEQEVVIEPGQAKSFPLDFGKVQLAHRGPTLLAKTFALQFSSTATTAKKGLKYAIVEQADNPMRLGDRTRIKVAGIESSQGIIPASTREATFEILADSALPPGDYAGSIRFEDSGLAVRGKGLTTETGGAQTLGWKLKVAKTPIPLWVWLAILAVLVVIAALVARHLMKPAVFSDLKLDVQEPAKQTLDLSGRQSARFGIGEEFLPTSPATFAIKPKKSGKTESALLELEKGTVAVKKQGSRDTTQILGDEAIFDGDVLLFGDHRVRVTSFSLVRE
jgi:hypothetical protein